MIFSVPHNMSVVNVEVKLLELRRLVRQGMLHHKRDADAFAVVYVVPCTIHKGTVPKKTDAVVFVHVYHDNTCCLYAVTEDGVEHELMDEFTIADLQ